MAMSAPFQIRKILFPVDFSKSGEVAANHVLGVAQATQAEVSLLHVVPWLAAWHGVSEAYFDFLGATVGRALQESQAAGEAAGLKMLERFQQQHFGGVRSHLCVRSGGVAESIVEYGIEINADVIMMTTHGWGPMRRFLIGSTAAKVLHDARCSVWTSPHIRELEPFRPYHRVLCAIDHRALSLQLVVQAAQIAHLFNSRLSVVSAIPHRGISPSDDPERRSAHSTKRDTVASIKSLLAESYIAASVHVVEGAEGEVIRQVALVEEADLIVIGQGHLEEPMGHLRTHAYEIIWNAPCPVWILCSNRLKA